MDYSSEHGVPPNRNMPDVPVVSPGQQEHDSFKYSLEYSDNSDTHSETGSVESEDNGNSTGGKEVNIAGNVFNGDNANHFFHPWGVVDYYLLLSAAECRTLIERRNCMYLINDDECVRVRERDLSDDHFFGPAGMDQNPKLLFSILPVAETAEKGRRTFDGQQYILGFDFSTQAFFARYFASIPDDIADIWSQWDNGETIYIVTVSELLELLDATFSGNYRAERGILNSTRYCVSQSRQELDDPGLELTIAIQFCQWMIDCADVVIRGADAWLQRHLISTKFCKHMETCRLILHRASYRAWFAVREGTVGDYKRKLVIEMMASDLFLSKDSAEVRAVVDSR